MLNNRINETPLFLNFDLQKKVNDLRAAVDVSGKPLIGKQWTDEQVASQIKLLIEQTRLADHELQTFMQGLIPCIPEVLTVPQAVAWCKDKIYTKINWPASGPLDKFWQNFGSAPYTTKGVKHQNVDPKKGHKGMDEIFDDAFEPGSHTLYAVPRFLADLPHTLQKNIELAAARKKVVTSVFRTLDEIEEECSVKKAPAAAKTLWQDKTIPMPERLQAFDKYGKGGGYIHSPHHPALHRIFDQYFEMDYCQRHEQISCSAVIEWWLEELEEQRCSVDYSGNSYHPELVRVDRNYTPREAALTRLENIYLELLMVEGVANFEFDW